MKMKILQVCLFMFGMMNLVQAQSGLKLVVYTSSPQGFSVNSTIVYGDQEAILIDPQFLLSEAYRVAADILESGKRLTTVYVTHPHPDHYFGLAVMRQVFPEARFVALPAVVDGIEQGWMARYNFWKGTQGHNIPATGPILPEQLQTGTLELEGNTLELHGGVEGDGPDNSYVWIPSLKAVVAGDILFSGSHFIVPADHAKWDATIAQIAALKPELVIPGHQIRGAPNDATVLDFMHDYMRDFDAAAAGSANAQEVVQKMSAAYPDMGLELLLTIGAGARFPQQ